MVWSVNGDCKQLMGMLAVCGSLLKPGIEHGMEHNKEWNGTRNGMGQGAEWNKEGNGTFL